MENLEIRVLAIDIIFLSVYSLLVLHQPNTIRHANDPSDILTGESQRSTSFNPFRSNFLSRRLRRRRIQSLLINPTTRLVPVNSLRTAS